MFALNISLGPPVVPFYPFFEGGFKKHACSTKALILTSLLEDLAEDVRSFLAETCSKGSARLCPLRVRFERMSLTLRERNRGSLLPDLGVVSIKRETGFVVQMGSQVLSPNVNLEFIRTVPKRVGPQ